jgi:hypothetical protein
MLTDIYFTEGSVGYLPTAVPDLIPLGLSDSKMNINFLHGHIHPAHDILTFVALVP